MSSSPGSAEGHQAPERRLRIAVVTQYFAPEDVPIPTSVPTELAKRGHDVRVVTGYPNYPAGKLFPGYRQRLGRIEKHCDVTVMRVPIVISHSQSAIGRVLSYLSFGVSSLAATSFVRGADVVYVYATQMTAAFAPWLWRQLQGTPYLLHVQDLWPDSVTGSTIWVRKRWAATAETVLTRWLASVYRSASAVIGIAPTMVQTLTDRGVEESKVHLVYNWGPDATATQAVPAAVSSSELTRVLFAGNVGDMQDLETAVRAAHRAYDAGIRLVIVGDGIALQRVKELARDLGASNVEFCDRVPSEQMATLYGEADFALVSLRDLPAFRGTIPSKLQAALAHGTPLITSVPGDVRRLVEDLRIGFAADPGSVEAVESAFRAAAACDLDQRCALADTARDVYRRQFSKAAGIDAIERVLTEVALPGAREGSGHV